MGVLKQFFTDDKNAGDIDYPFVNYELIVTDDDDLIGDVSIARNFQNRVDEISIYGRKGLFDDLELAMQKHDLAVKLQKRETDFADDRRVS